MYRRPGITDKEVARIERDCPDHFSCAWDSCTCERRGPIYKHSQAPAPPKSALDHYYAFKSGKISEEQLIDFLRRQVG